MAAIPFPRSSTPGLRPGEGEGRLINAFTEKAGDALYVRRAPGLAPFATTAKTNPRGFIDIDGAVFAAFDGSVVVITSTGIVTATTGTLTGSDGVTWARNNRVIDGAPATHVVAVRETGGAFSVTGSAVAAYPDADLPATVNSVSFLGGFFLFTIPDGRIFASELNSTDINALSFATAEAQPDGLKRGIVHGGVFYAMGSNSIEPWLNVGASPFPLARGTSVIPVGLLTTMAVAGMEMGWDHEPFFVAHDGTVRALRGYQAPKVSTPDVDAFIARSAVASLEACVYTAKGNAFWSLTSDQGTWEFNVLTGVWHERISEGLTRWRGSRSVKSNGRWLVGDRTSGAVLAVSDTVVTEDGEMVEWIAESTAFKGYPARIQVPALFCDFTQADDAIVDVSWSHDGGETWALPISRDLDTADRYPVRVNRLGLSTHHGLRVRLSCADAADFSFMGASVPDPSPRRG